MKIKKQIRLVEKPQRIYGERGDLAEQILSQELGKRYVDYRKQWLKASNREQVSEFPLYLQIEHSARCNLRCVSCLQGIKTLRENYNKNLPILDIGLYKKIIKEAQKYRCPSIAFHNNDEPLLLPDLEERIKLAKEAGFLDLIMTTNANLLTKARTDKLLRAGLTKINFSVDACTKKDYQKVRINGDFDRVLKNIEYFLAQKKKFGLKLPITRATCVLSKLTVKNMKKFRQFWQKKGVDVVEFQNFQALKGQTESLKPVGAEIDRSFVCNGPWQQLVIRPNGDVLPCCSFYGATLVLGNVRESSLHSLWRGQKMAKIRKELLKNNFKFSPVCQMCSETFYVIKI